MENPPVITLSPAVWRDRFDGIRYLVAKVTHVHGAAHPELSALEKAVRDLSDCRHDDQEQLAGLRARIGTLTNGFTPWAGGCGSVERLYRGLAEICADLTPPER